MRVRLQAGRCPSAGHAASRTHPFPRQVRKLALTAAMRKLLVILHAMLRDRTGWNPDHAAATNL
jgi:hypothetical protein